MKKLVSSYSYKNGASIKIYYVDKTERRGKEDNLQVEIKPFDGNPIAWAMRPDEAVLLIKLLAEAVNRVAAVWKVGLQKTKQKY